MPTTYDMTGDTHRGIQRCLRWLHRDHRSAGNAYGRNISVVVGRGIHAQAWGDELEIRDAETNRLRRPRWWERARHSEKQRTFLFRRFCPLVVQHVYCHGGEYDVELQTHPDARISEQVLVFGNSRRDSRWYIQAIRIHDVPARVADGASLSPPGSMGAALADFSDIVNTASSRASSLHAGLHIMGDHIGGGGVPVNGDDCMFDDDDYDGDNSPVAWAAEPAPELFDSPVPVRERTPRLHSSPLPEPAPVNRSPYLLSDRGIDPPVAINSEASVHNWLERATSNQRESFAAIHNGDPENVRLFFVGLVRDILINGGSLIESSARRVFACDTDQLVGYNLTIDNEGHDGASARISMALINGDRWTYQINSLSQIVFSGNLLHTRTEEPAPVDPTPPIPVNSAVSLCTWLEEATPQQVTAFMQLSGDDTAIELFFTELITDALVNGGWVEQSDRRVYSTRHELIGYNLLISPRPTHALPYHVSIDLITGSRITIGVGNISSISTPHFPQDRPGPDLNMSRFRSTFGSPVAQVRPEPDNENERDRRAYAQPAARPGRRWTCAERDNQLREAYGGGPIGDVLGFEIEMRGNWNRCDT